jgi:ADP-ribose pyrophosphatase
VTEDRAVDPKTGFEIKRSVVRHGGSAVMMAVDGRSACCWCGNTGSPPGSICGNCRPDASIPARSRSRPRRELIEETGYRARQWTRLASFWVSPGYVQERMTIYLATDLTPVRPPPWTTSASKTRWFTRKEVAG